MEIGLFTVELTTDEKVLLNAIQFDPVAFQGNRQVFNKNADLAQKLTISLLTRNAIPDGRLRYFYDPEYNLSYSGKSRKDVFEQNGICGEAIFQNPHFLKFLRYFIYGPDLPSSISKAFIKAVHDCGPITSSDIVPLGNTARQLARTHNLHAKEAADEFYKLCLDLNLSSSDAAIVRSSVQQLQQAR